MAGVFFNPLTRLLIRVLIIGVIAVAHMRALFVLYPSQNSVVVRFVVPTLGAFCLYLVVLLRKHLVLSVVLALMLTLLSLAGGMIAAINTYGS